VSRQTTRLCTEPNCPEVIVDAHPGARCDRHRATSWDRWRADQDPAKSMGYGHTWRRFRAGIIRERGARCEECGATGVPLSLHHLDHQPPSSPRGFDPSNVKLACTACHVRESRRRVA
jgi:5-methylcytosine-specific restriction protein A